MNAAIRLEQLGAYALAPHVLLSTALLLGCGAKASGPTGTNTNWLSRCTTGQQCGNGLSCLCGACTTHCDSSAACSGLGANAVCAPAKSSCEEAAPLCDRRGEAAQVTTGNDGLSTGGEPTRPGMSSEPDVSGEPNGELPQGGKPNYARDEVREGVWCGDPRKDYVASQCAGINLACVPGFYDACGCGCWLSSDEQNPAVELSSAQLSQEWLLLGPQDSPNYGESLVRTPEGWLALQRESVGDGKVAPDWNNWLERSTDGLNWQREDIPLPTTSAYLRALAYGNERYVAVGANASKGVIWTSSNAKSWDTIELGSQGFLDVEFIGGRFYAYTTFKQVFYSESGSSWTELSYSGAGISDVTLGSETVVAAGSGPFLVGTYPELLRGEPNDGWQSVLLDCDVNGNCDSDPDGNPFQKVVSRVLFNPKLKLFHAGHFTSLDGVSWTPTSGGAPEAVLDSKWVSFVRDQEGLPGGLQLWDEESAHSVPLGSDNPDGLSCADGQCVLLDDELVLIPAP